MERKREGKRNMDTNGFTVITKILGLERNYGEKTTTVADDARLVYSVDKIHRKMEDYSLLRNKQEYCIGANSTLEQSRVG